MKLKIALILILSTWFNKNLFGQYMIGMSTALDNDMSEWIIYPENDSLPECRIRARWRLEQDPTEWDFRMGEISGTLRSKWRNRFDEWEIICDNEIVRVKMVWPGDWRQWRIESKDGEFQVKALYNMPVSQLTVSKRDEVLMNIDPSFENDPRDWIIQDDLPEDAHLSTRMGIFSSVILSLVLRNL